MWSRLKAMPGWAKIVIACVVVLGIYGASQQHPPQPPGSQTDYGAHRIADPRGQATDTDADAQLLAKFETQYAELAPKIKECMEEQNQATTQMGAAAMNGEMVVSNDPPCAQYMPQWVVDASVAETEIYRLKTGDRHSSYRQINGFPDSPSGSSSSSSRPAMNSDDAQNRADDWDRQVIRGNSMYTDENNQQHELPTAPYYYRNRATGQFVASQSPEPPNDGQDYERLTAQN